MVRRIQFFFVLLSALTLGAAISWNITHGPQSTLRWLALVTMAALMIVMVLQFTKVKDE